MNAEDNEYMGDKEFPTKESALDWLDYYLNLDERNNLIRALEQEPCEDAISRQAVLSKIKEVCFSEEWLQFRVDKGSNGQRDFLIDYIEQLPPATPQPKTGRWIRYKENCCYNKCSRCEYEHCKESNYCPNCGAKMQEVEK